MSSTRTSTGSTFAYGLALFAGILMIVSGVFHILEGIAALANDEFFVKTPNYTYNVDITGWGWIQIIVGVIIGLIGLGVVMGNLLARILGIVAVVFLMIDNFLFIPYYPFWSILMIVLDGLILWALAVAPAKE